MPLSLHGVEEVNWTPNLTAMRYHSVNTVQLEDPSHISSSCVTLYRSPGITALRVSYLPSCYLTRQLLVVQAVAVVPIALGKPPSEGACAACVAALVASSSSAGQTAVRDALAEGCTEVRAWSV
jgi:hypothetical protein